MISQSAMIKAAKKSKHHSQLHAAFIFKGGAIVSIATNNARYHAEERALAQINFKARNASLLSVRIGKSGKLRNARPCRMCRDIMKYYKLRTVFYSTEEGKIVRERI